MSQGLIVLSFTGAVFVLPLAMLASLPDENGKYLMIWGIPGGIIIFLSIVITVISICLTVLLTKRMEIRAQLSKKEMEVREKEIQFYSDNDKLENSELRKEIAEIKREIESIKHVSGIRDAREGRSEYRKR